MDTQGAFADIRDQLVDAEKSISAIFKNKVEKLTTTEVKEKFKHFVDTEVLKTEQEIRHCIKTIDSPVFVGLLGRYSHGKTALVNSLFSLDSEFSLVEGEGVVTSKITRVEFSENLVTPKCFECYRNGEQSAIDIVTLQASVSGKGGEDNSIIDHYYLKLPAIRAFAQVFEKKMINLIDMPGLGGPYFKDTEKTKKYIEHLDMLLVVLKISEIDQASRVIDPYIENMVNKNIPMIPIITFFDKWRENPKFTDCVSDEDAIEKARREIKECIPSLGKHMTRMIAVSAKSGFQVDNLRELILKFVEMQTFAIGKIRKENSDVFKRKIKEVQKTLDDLLLKSEKSIDFFRKNIETVLPEKGDLQRFSKSFERHSDKLLKDGKIKIARSVKDISSDIKDKANEIRYRANYADISDAIAKIKDDVNRNSLRELREQVGYTFSAIKEKIENNLEQYIDKLELNTENKESLRENALEIVNNSTIALEDIVYEPPEITSNMTKDYSKTIAEAIFGAAKNPQIIIPFVVGLVISQIPFISILGYILMVGALGFAFFDNSAKTKNFNKSKNEIIDKLASSFDRQTIEDEAYRALSASTAELLQDIDEALSDDVTSYGKDLKIIKESAKEFKSRIELLNKSLSREVAKMDVSEG